MVPILQEARSAMDAAIPQSARSSKTLWSEPVVEAAGTLDCALGFILECSAAIGAQREAPEDHRAQAPLR